MPELPEVEITVRILDQALRGAVVTSVRVTGVGTLRSYDPPITSLEGRKVLGVRRRGKHPIIEFSEGLTLLIHLMSAGRLQVFDKAGSLRDRTSRLMLGLQDGRELRLREFGTKQAAWVKLVRTPQLDDEESLSTLGPEAWPDPPALRPLLRDARPLHSVLRDQRVIAGIGRSWVDEILHATRVSPFKRASDLTDEETERLRDAIVEVLGSTIRFYEEKVSLTVPDKFPMPLKVHRRTGEPCPRCGTEIAAVFYEDYVMCYCPACQTGGKVLKDRRLSRLLK